jgi:hypothetical protein
VATADSCTPVLVGQCLVREMFERPVGGSSVGVLSVVILVFSGVSLVRGVQRMYRDAW